MGIAGLANRHGPWLLTGHCMDYRMVRVGDGSAEKSHVGTRLSRMGRRHCMIVESQLVLLLRGHV